MVEDNIRLVLNEYNSKFITSETSPGIYFFKDLTDVVSGDLKSGLETSHSIEIEYDDISVKTKLVVRSGIIAIRFDETSFLSTILGFTPHWDYKHYNENIGQKLFWITLRF